MRSIIARTLDARPKTTCDEFLERPALRARAADAGYSRHDRSPRSAGRASDEHRWPATIATTISPLRDPRLYTGGTKTRAIIQTKFVSEQTSHGGGDPNLILNEDADSSSAARC